MYKKTRISGIRGVGGIIFMIPSWGALLKKPKPLRYTCKDRFSSLVKLQTLKIGLCIYFC